MQSFIDKAIMHQIIDILFNMRYEFNKGRWIDLYYSLPEDYQAEP